MKAMIFKLALINLCLPMMFVQAESFFTAPEQVFEIKAPNVHSKFEESAFNPEGILRRFKANGLTMKNTVINGSTIQFTAQKTIMGVPVPQMPGVPSVIQVYGELSLERASSGCKDGENAYDGKMDFSRSGATLSDNITELRLVVCTTEKSSSHLVVRVKSKLMKGNNYSSFYGDFAKKTIQEQISSIIAATKADVLSRR